MATLHQIERLLIVTGLVFMMLGLVLGFLNLQGWLEDKDKTAVLNWVLTSSSGLQISHPGAKKFMHEFPPPLNAKRTEITHLTKHITKLENGLVQYAQINYMLSDLSRTSYVATLNDVRNWAAETSYNLWAWILSLIGFIEMASIFIIQYVHRKRTNS